jgi:hypothetical protein
MFFSHKKLFLFLNSMNDFTNALRKSPKIQRETFQHLIPPQQIYNLLYVFFVALNLTLLDLDLDPRVLNAGPNSRKHPGTNTGYTLPQPILENPKLCNIFRRMSHVPHTTTRLFTSGLLPRSFAAKKGKRPGFF